MNSPPEMLSHQHGRDLPGVLQRMLTGVAPRPEDVQEFALQRSGKFELVLLGRPAHQVQRLEVAIAGRVSTQLIIDFQHDVRPAVEIPAQADDLTALAEAKEHARVKEHLRRPEGERHQKSGSAPASACVPQAANIRQQAARYVPSPKDRPELAVLLVRGEHRDVLYRLGLHEFVDTLTEARDHLPRLPSQLRRTALGVYERGLLDVEQLSRVLRQDPEQTESELAEHGIT
jgi:hypothetical protein